MNGSTPAFLKEDVFVSISFLELGLKSPKREIMNQNKSAHTQEILLDRFFVAENIQHIISKWQNSG